MEKLSQEKVEVDYPNAFYALPEPYQNDSCLDFFIEDGFLHATPKKDQTFALGHWTVYFEKDLESWADNKTNELIG